MQFSTVLVGALATLTSAAPTPAVKSTASIIEQIAPKSSSCASADFPDECRTAEQAGPLLFAGMEAHGLTSPNQQAALLSLVALESGDFQYKRNKFPGRPGQGTSNMQMAQWNLKYAKSIDAVKGEVDGIESVDGLADDELNRILDLVVDDKYNFASGAWFMKTQCGDAVLQALAADIDSGYQQYMQCVGVTVDDSRQQYFNRAKAAFGL